MLNVMVAYVNKYEKDINFNYSKESIILSARTKKKYTSTISLWIHKIYSK